MRAGEKFIVNLACTGVIPTHAMNPYVPITHEQIIEDVRVALGQGVQMLHLHARDAEGAQTSAPEPYARLIEDIRKLPGGLEATICVTTSGRNIPDISARAAVLDLDGAARPDMASLTLSSLNFAQSASINAPDTIRALAERMQTRRIRPELEVFDLGMANFVRVLLKEGLITAPLYVNVLLGNITGAQVDPVQLGAILAALPPGCIVSVAGLGRNQLSASGLGLLFADGVRIGLEDNIWYDGARRVPATNATLVARVLRLATEFERPLATRSEVRKWLGLFSEKATL